MKASDIGIRICKKCGRTEIKYRQIHNHIMRCFGDSYKADRWGKMVGYGRYNK